MGKLIVKTGCFLAFAAMGMGCGARDEARGDDTATRVTSGTLDETPSTSGDPSVSAEPPTPTTPPPPTRTPAEVPALVCASSASEYGVAEWTVRTIAGATTGTAALRRYSIVDGQTFLVAIYTVAATEEATDTGGVERVLADADGAFELRINEAGNALGHARTLVGTLFDLALTCTAPAAPPAPPPTTSVGGGHKGKPRK